MSQKNTNRATKTIPINNVKPNPDNPRVIKDNDFRRLVQSISDFPEMLEVRPIVLNKDMMIIGGNMRYKACKEAGIKNVPVIIADHFTPEQEKEFTIKDNVSGGEWDWDVLVNAWDVELLSEWGFDIPSYVDPTAIKTINEMDEWIGMPEFEVAGQPERLVVQFETEEEREAFVNKIGLRIGVKRKGAWSTWWPYKERQDNISKKYE